MEYADSAKFHIDILPALPDHETRSAFRPGAILITDRTLRAWQHSNPKGYAEWFKERMQTQFFRKLKLLAEDLRMSIEDVPEYKVKTPLQRAIQIFKRHRDIMFEDDPEGKPASIIISTLAAHSYNNESDIFDAVLQLIRHMEDFIQNRDGVLWIPNPVNPEENFADRWRNHPERERKFRAWLRQIQADFGETLEKRSTFEMAESLKPRFGDRLVNASLKALLPATAVASSSREKTPYIRVSNPSKPWGS